jgi:hypothetical protein
MGVTFDKLLGEPLLHRHKASDVDGITGGNVPSGGDSGQVLAKKTNDDFDTEWITGGGVSGVSSVDSQTGDVDLSGDYEPKNENIQSHISDTNNPHNVTAEQVGALTTETDPIYTTDKPDIVFENDNISRLTNDVDYITSSDIPEPPVISVDGLTGEVDLSGDYEPKNTNIQSHISSTSNPHSVTKTQVGLGNVPNLDTTNAVNKAHDAVTVTDSIEIDFTLTGQDITASLKNGSISATKLDTGVNTSLGKADTALQAETDPIWTADKPSYSTKTTADTLYEPKNSNIQSHISSTSNPHSVTAAQIGALTTETDPVWTSEKSNYSTKTVADGLYEPKNANIQSHISSTSNPHSVTANQVLPSQTSNDGKFLKTDGTNPTWQKTIISGTSTTARTTAGKTCTISGYTPAAGDLLAITFTDGFSVNNATLNINGGGAVNIRVGGVNVTTALLSVAAGTSFTLPLYYDGSHYYAYGSSLNTNTTYAEISEAEIDAGTATNTRSISGRRVGYILGKAFAADNKIDGKSIVIDNLQNGDLLTFDSTSDTWVNKSKSALGIDSGWGQ